MKKRTLATKMTAAALAALMLLSGCGAKPEEKEPVSDAPVVSEETSTEEEIPTITIAAEVKETGEYSDANWAINYLQEQTGVNIEFVALPSGEDALTKLNLMLSSDDYPDVICYELTKSQMIKFGKEGIFIPQNDLLEEFGENMKVNYEERPNYLKNAYAPDGNIYGVPTYSESYHTTAYPKLWYNKVWLESLGLSEPTTTEELKEVLTAVKNSDYNGNGKADEIPLTGNVDWTNQTEWSLMNSFIPCDKTTLSYAKDGQVVFACDKDEFKQGLAYMNDLYEEGLLDPSMFTQSQDQMAQVIRGDDNLVFAYAGEHFGIGIDVANETMNRSIEVLCPVEGPTGAAYQPHFDTVDRNGTFTWFITDKCEHPDAAFRVADFLVKQENAMSIQFGEEGTYWKKLDDPVPSIIPGVETPYWTDAVVHSNPSEDYNKNTWWSGLYQVSNNHNINPRVDESKLYIGDGYETRLSEATAKVEPYFYPEYLIKNVYFEDEADNEKFITIQTSLQEYVKSSMAQFITGELSLESDWDSYVQNLQSYDVATYVELYQQAFDVFNGK